MSEKRVRMNDIRDYLQTITDVQAVSVEEWDTDAQRIPWTFRVALNHRGRQVSGLFITDGNGGFPTIERIKEILEQ